MIDNCSRLFFTWRPGWRGGFVAIEAVVNPDGEAFYQDIKSKKTFCTLQEAGECAALFHSMWHVRKMVKRIAFPFQHSVSILHMREWEHPARVQRDCAPGCGMVQ